jgi:hypothetical protein
LGPLNWWELFVEKLKVRAFGPPKLVGYFLKKINGIELLGPLNRGIFLKYCTLG